MPNTLLKLKIGLQINLQTQIQITLDRSRRNMSQFQQQIPYFYDFYAHTNQTIYLYKKCLNNIKSENNKSHIFIVLNVKNINNIERITQVCQFSQ